MNKLFATLVATAFLSTGAFAADAKKDEKAAAATPAASKAATPKAAAPAASKADKK